MADRSEPESRVDAELLQQNMTDVIENVNRVAEHWGVDPSSLQHAGLDAEMKQAMESFGDAKIVEKVLSSPPVPRADPNLRTCDVCSSLSAPYACGGCQCQYYCCKACQTLAWKKPRDHKSACKSYEAWCESSAAALCGALKNVESDSLVVRMGAGMLDCLHEEHCFFLASTKFGMFAALEKQWDWESDVILSKARESSVVNILHNHMNSIFIWPRKSPTSLAVQNYSKSDPSRTLLFLSSSPTAWRSLLRCSLANVATALSPSTPRRLRSLYHKASRDILVNLGTMLAYGRCVKAAMEPEGNLDFTLKALRATLDLFKEDLPEDLDPNSILEANLNQNCAVIEIFCKKLKIGSVDMVKAMNFKGQRKEMYNNMALPMAANHILAKGDGN